MGASLGLIVLDETVVGVALPTIQQDLGMSQSGAHWVVNAYLLVFTCAVAAGGRLGDIIGLDRALLAGLAIFAMGSASAGFAESPSWIIAARAFQGIGAGVIFPTSVAMVTQVFSIEQRGLALGIHTSIGGVFMSSGPLVGGLLTQSASWRWIFWVNLPIIALIALAVIKAWRPSASDGPAQRSLSSIDWRGLTVFVFSMGALVVALMEGEGWGWTTPLTLGLLAAGVAGLAGFVGLQKQSADPLMDIALFRDATFSGSNLVIFTQQFSKIAIVVFVALYLQDVGKLDPLDAGMLIFAGGFSALITSTFAGMATDRWGTRIVAQLGLILNGSAFVVIGVMVGSGQSDWIVLPLILWGATLPWLMVPCRRAVMNAVRPDQHGQAGGISVTAQMLGGTLGMAVCGTLLVATGSYEAVFLVTAAWILVTFAVAWLTIK